MGSGISYIPTLALKARINALRERASGLSLDAFLLTVPPVANYTIYPPMNCVEADGLPTYIIGTVKDEYAPNRYDLSCHLKTQGLKVDCRLGLTTAQMNELCRLEATVGLTQ